ncbi:hypothetical protein IMSAG117_01387 [Lactobacillaceae bacterium]|nr:hypothetical protein IMSAG117_01387 [Lactobacillaceae bacterium]
MIFTRTPSTSIFLKLCAKASAEPCTSALMIRSTSFRSPSFKVSNKLSKVTCVVWLRSLIKARLARSSPAARAVFSSSNVIKRSPESGTSFRPVISTGVAGVAFLIERPRASVIVRTRPKVLPTTIGSPTCNVPCCTSNEATEPLPLSSRASITEPAPCCLALAFNSSISASSKIISSNSSKFLLNLAEISTKIVSPPQLSGISSYSDNCSMTWFGLAPGLSILLTATMIGTLAALAWLIASIVCGITPSSAATTKTVISVISAPRARMLVKAACPGVSKNVIVLPE